MIEPPGELLDVAVGVLTRGDGQFLLTQRPSGKPMSGYWEFPGGKLEPGESVLAALVREFTEELGIQVTDAVPWIQRVHVYPHAAVRLHYWRILSWSGTACGREGQTLSWEKPGNAGAEPWLAGALPLKRWLQLPNWYAISDALRVSHTQFLRHLDAALSRCQIRFLQLREKQLDSDAFQKLFCEVHACTREHGVQLLVNSFHPERFWHLADGVHCTAETLMALTRRPSVSWCGASCHDATQLKIAAGLDLDFAVVGPVKQTATHPDVRPLGWEGFAAVVRDTPLPVYALGGLGRHELATAIRHGAQGVAAIRGSWGTDPLLCISAAQTVGSSGCKR